MKDITSSPNTDYVKHENVLAASRYTVNESDSATHSYFMYSLMRTAMQLRLRGLGTGDDAY